MQSVLISIRPQWCELIANGEKTIEVRKSRPKLETPFKCYIYCTQAKPGWFNMLHMTRLDGKVIGEFVCDEMYGIYYSMYPHDPPVFEELGTLNRPDLMAETCLSEIEINDYLDGETGYGWHISALQIYDKPKELSEFASGNSRLEFSNTEDGFSLRWSGMVRPPQSWCYVEELEEPCKTKK